ncbi:transposase, partial [Collinsella aerofaciens ATCC 25986]
PLNQPPHALVGMPAGAGVRGETPGGLLRPRGARQVVPRGLDQRLSQVLVARLGDRAPAVALPAGGLATLMWTVPGGAQETGGPYMRDPRHPRHFTDEFKRQIVDLYNAGKPKREIMDEYDLGKSTVERWIKSINATGSPRAACNRTPEQNRILELERENRRLRMEVDVLKQAALIYARK